MGFIYTIQEKLIRAFKTNLRGKKGPKGSCQTNETSISKLGLTIH